MKGVGCRTWHLGGWLALMPVWSRAQESTVETTGHVGWWVAGGLVVVVGLGLWLRARAQTSNAHASLKAGAGHSQFDPLTPKSYSPLNVGNDASARPWEQVPQSQASQGIESPRRGPEGFERAAFLTGCKADFLALQDAWDKGAVESVRTKLSPAMLERIQQQLTERAAQGAAPTKTEVFNLQAQLVQLEEAAPGGWTASVEFAGLSRDEAAAGPGPFREIWQFSCKPDVAAAQWLVDDVQAIR